MNTIKDLAVAFAVSAALASAAHATLPPAPEAAKEQAKEAAAKTAWQDKVAAYKLCQVQDQVVDKYRKDAKGEGKPAPAPISAATCMDPGPYVSPLAQKPLEAAGAHSPPAPATAPPNVNATAAETMGAKKP